jgi:nucleotide-binding universal stress UspA family protein
MKHFILGIDGEQWTEKAILYALEITQAFKGNLTVIHVIDPYLKKFADEIYAVGRDEYRYHIDKCLASEADKIINGFKTIAEPYGLSCHMIVRYGSPEEEILNEISQNSYDLLIIGKKQANTFQAKIGSFHLPRKIFSNVKIPILFVQ